jgi:adenine phosphoribosyltransferase
MDHLKALIREVADFPKPGINFYDITTLLKDESGYRTAIDGLLTAVADMPCDLILGIEARGFMFAPSVAYATGKGFVPVRKPGKLPYKTTRVEYALEYGKDSLEIHTDGIAPGQRVLVVDDVLATGGTASAVGKLVENLGGIVAGFAFVIELDFLGGRAKLGSHAVTSLLHY